VCVWADRCRPKTPKNKNRPSQGWLAQAAPITGHREAAWRGRFREARAAEAVSDYELLEVLLYRDDFRGSTPRPIRPKRLIAKFGLVSPKLLAAAAAAAGGGERGVKEATSNRPSKLFTQLASRMDAGRSQRTGKCWSSWTAVLDYCRTKMAFEDKERFGIIFLDKTQTR